MHFHHHLHSFWRLPFVLGAIAFEVFVFLAVRRRDYPWREMVTSFGSFLLRLPMRVLRPFIVAPVALILWSHRIATVPVHGLGGLAALFFAVDLAYYWMHRSAHRIRWMWASHIVHHTPEHLHLASAFRLGATELLSGSWLFYVPLYLLGLDPLAVSGMLAVNLFYQFWLHTELIGRLGPLEWLLNTPSHHRVHHASNPEYIDRNFGGILILWDRIFGTFAEELPSVRIRYGLAHPIGSLNPLTLVSHEWVAMARDALLARTWRERWQRLFGAPEASAAGVD
ncbi:MAG TPA: sterol desaturase family protein [Steroidobacteraceae bacterium]|nr:sterol desaturase family protein [Steroidobacteraceae bacterium]